MMSGACRVVKTKKIDRTRLPATIAEEKRLNHGSKEGGVGAGTEGRSNQSYLLQMKTESFDPLHKGNPRGRIERCFFNFFLCLFCFSVPLRVSVLVSCVFAPL